MITIRKEAERGRTQLDWLRSFHTFSFADYYDPYCMGFGILRVINEDTVKPGKGFLKHPHKNMEIISYVVEGALEHRDSLGTGSVIKPGEIQRMSAGTGIEHSEFNSSSTEPVHFLQIWIIPEKNDLTPGYEQKIIANRTNQWILIGAKEPSLEAVKIHQDVKLWAAYLIKNHIIEYVLHRKRQAWLQLIKGCISLNDQQLSAGDGAMIVNETKLNIFCIQDAELLFFDLNQN